MPYIEQARRGALDVRGEDPKSAGELNYLLTKTALEYYLSAKRGDSGNYCVMNTIMGAFESAKAEFYRRVVAPYEELKILENGDVYPPELKVIEQAGLSTIPAIQRTGLTKAEEEYCGDDVAGEQPDMGYHDPAKWPASPSR